MVAPAASHTTRAVHKSKGGREFVLIPTAYAVSASQIATKLTISRFPTGAPLCAASPAAAEFNRLHAL
jgi:hypothetical protein